MVEIKRYSSLREIVRTLYSNHMKKEHQPAILARDIFIQLFSIVTLIWSIVAALQILFTAIEHFIPTGEGWINYGGVASASAALLVVLPLSLLAFWFVHRDLRENPNKRDGLVRSFALYLMLFGSAITALISLVVVITNFFSGNLTSQITWKVLVVVLMAVQVGKYFYFSKTGKFSKNIYSYFFPGAVVFAGLAVIAVGMVAAGTPASQRSDRLDQERFNDIANMEWQIRNHLTEKGELPEQLQELEQMEERWGRDQMSDPETQQPYEYIVYDGLYNKEGLCKEGPSDDCIEPGYSYELCANFAKDRQDNRLLNNRYMSPISSKLDGFGNVSEQNSYKAGRHCFRTTFDPANIERDRKMREGVDFEFPMSIPVY